MIHMRVIALWITLIFSETSAEIMLKLGAIRAASSGWMPNSLLLCAYGFYMISFLVWMQILKRVRLFIALSIATIMYATIAVSAHFLFGEVITYHIILGTLLITAGLFLLGWGKRGRKGGVAM